ncbi:uncharacterized protein LOC131000924 isoform X1 [Salvia miltiorrhiza]|uniref:uncharacterized protein LOC131000924 isoform X1 n=1 Tax=Salvia miltiorrhiza TaxID=226208 RepID=UPI0025AD6A4C|nr:uncharacterized protein LOC131000924 isoform X1 [Salvia miltiorrhiza]
MAAAVLSSSSLCCYASFRDIRIPHPAKLASAPREFGTAFATGSPLSIRTPIYRRKAARSSTSVSVRCEQSTKGNGLDVWLGRLAMVGFAAAISVEIATGKGLLEVCHVYQRFSSDLVSLSCCFNCNGDCEYGMVSSWMIVYYLWESAQ